MKMKCVIRFFDKREGVEGIKKKKNYFLRLLCREKRGKTHCTAKVFCTHETKHAVLRHSTCFCNDDNKWSVEGGPNRGE